MNAVFQLDDSFARIGLTVLRGAGLRVGELLDLELGSVIDYGPAGTWLNVPLGKLATERMVPLSAGTIAALDEWTGRRVSAAHSRIPAPEHRPISCSSPMAAASARPGRATDSSPPSSPADCAEPAAHRWSLPHTSYATPGPPNSPTPG